jgi:hypothetical protein
MVASQNAELEEIQHDATANIEELSEQRGKMEARTKDTESSLWSTVVSLVVAFVAFLTAVLVCRVFPRPF